MGFAGFSANFLKGQKGSRQMKKKKISNTLLVLLIILTILVGAVAVETLFSLPYWLSPFKFSNSIIIVSNGDNSSIGGTGKHVTFYDGDDPDITIPKKIGWTEICGVMLQGNNIIKNVDMSDEFTEVEVIYFKDCEKLKKMSIPDSVTEIERLQFENCENLKKVKLPDDLATIHEFTLENCPELENIEIPEDVEYIGLYTKGCDNVTFTYDGRIYDYKHIDELRETIRINNE